MTALAAILSLVWLASGAAQLAAPKAAEKTAMAAAADTQQSGAAMRLAQFGTVNDGSLTNAKSAEDPRRAIDVTAARARVISETAQQTSVTIYPDNLALITEVRKVNVPAGRSVIAFEGVSDLIIPQSMILREFTGLTLERNFDYDLLSKTSLFENAVGEFVTLTRFDAASGAVVDQSAEIISARRDTGVVMKVNGKLETLSCSGLTERVSFGAGAGGLSAKPVMSVQVSAQAAGEQEVVISYLTSGLGWRADYRADLKAPLEDKPTATREASLLAWLTLTNDTAKDYSDVPLAIIAGDLNRDRDTRAAAPPKPYLQGQCYPIGSTKTGISQGRFAVGATTSYFGGGPELPPGAPMPEMASAYAMSDEVIVTGARKMAREENVGDYKLYRVPGLVSVKPYQTKQIAFLDEASVEMRAYFKLDIYGFNDRTKPAPLTLAYDLNNDREEGLARALPKGTFRIFDRRINGQTIYLGESRIENKAVDEEVELVIDQSFNVLVKSEAGKLRRSVTHSFFNAMDEMAAVKVMNQDQSLRGKNKVSSDSPRDPDEIIPTWWIDIPAQSSAELSYSKR